MERKGFWLDLKAIPDASVEEFMVAQNIATKRETLGSAASRADMPAKVSTALRSVLLSVMKCMQLTCSLVQVHFFAHQTTQTRIYR